MLFQPGEGGPFGGPRRRGIGDGLIARRPGDPSLFVKSENALLGKIGPTPAGGGFPHGFALVAVVQSEQGLTPAHPVAFRSEARRVGKECVNTCRSRWSPDP